MRAVIVGIIGTILLQNFANAQVRKAAIKADDILTVKTALGIATIIQLSETIQSAIIGDQSGFKVEYLDRAVTIKPLRSGARTNLYLVTEKRRYNVRLTTLDQSSADYIVYVKSPDLEQRAIQWTKLGKIQKLGAITFSIDRVGKSASGFVLLDGKLSTNSNQEILVKPEDFEVKQVGASKVINGLYLSSVKGSKSNPILIGVSLAKSDLMSKKPITVELKSGNLFSLVLSEDVIWR